MTTLKQLIDQLCPDGVEYVRLGDVAEVGTGSCDRKNATDDGEYPFFVRSQQVFRYPTYQFDEEAIIVPGEGGIGDIFHYINGRYALHQRAYRVHFKSDDVNTKFALYVFKTAFKNYVVSRAVTATVSSLRKPMFTEFPIPLPPREVQDKIVEYLDAFAALCGNLDIEIAQREQQFAEYREKLLSVDYLKARYCPSGVDYVRLGDVAPYANSRVSAETLDRSTFVGVDNLLKNMGGKVDSEYGANTKMVTGFVAGDVLVGNIRPYLKKIWIADVEGGCSGDVLAFHPTGIAPRFLLHNLCTDRFWNYNIQNSKGAKMPRGDKKILPEFPIPLPPLETQREIADKLDAMQALIDNLRLEREQRQQQFDYYREKLLTFTVKDTAEV